MQTIQGIQQQQIQVGDRPIMPVVSMSTQPGAPQVQQAIQQAIPGAITQAGMQLQPNLAVTQQPMPVSMQQLHPQLAQMAPPGTIIGQIQATQAQPAAIPQVQAGAAQMQQIQAAAQQAVTIAATLPQQVSLPPTMPMKEEVEVKDVHGADGGSHGVVAVETPKETVMECKLYAYTHTHI